MKTQWWHDKVAYQIYPKSFCDTNGDGIGDLPGVLSKLDYLKELGVDIIWISPVYASPFVDQGYDISDYYGIAEQFGSMEDFDRLLAGAKARGISIIMDLVVNHCSDKHEWFQKALADPYGEYADYFYFRKGRDGQPPNNYRSYFGGSTWGPVPGTNLFYFHSFAPQQPDLNWENPALRKKIYDMINWWMDKGVAGFRIDAIMNIKKDLSFPMLPPDGPDGLASVIGAVENADGIDERLEELKANTFAKHGAFTVSEVFGMKPGTLGEFIGDDGHFSTIFDFCGELLCEGGAGWYAAKPFEFDKWRDAVFEQQALADGIGFMANIVENHDEPRGASRYLPAFAQNTAGKKLLGTVSVLLRGLPFLYQGQELGMTNYPWQSAAEFDDISTLGEYRLALDAGLSEADALRACAALSRDNARTPVQWTAAKNAGFTTGTPWMPVNPNYPEVNAEAEEADPASVLHYYKKLIALRKDRRWKDVFVYGRTCPVAQELPGIFAYERVLDGRRVLVAANCTEESARVPLRGAPGELLLCNMERSDGESEDKTERESMENSLYLRPLEAVVLELMPV